MSRLRAFTDFGPLVLFFATNLLYGFMAATAVLMAGTLIAVTVSWFAERRVPVLPLIGAVVLGIFGGLTLYFDDAIFLKLKPTVASLLIAAVLGGGLLFGRNLLQMALGQALPLDDRGWRRLTLYWIGVLVLTAAINEVAWRSMSTDDWVTFKTFALPLISVIAAIGSAPVMRSSLQRSAVEEDKAG